VSKEDEESHMLKSSIHSDFSAIKIGEKQPTITDPKMMLN
jgi:hypothetical protein|tara:strand:+ start:509 stop:628 length:120 start_codon:yes stop_codon:yes gene_type:complete